MLPPLRLKAVEVRPGVKLLRCPGDYVPMQSTRGPQDRGHGRPSVGYNIHACM